MKKPGKRPRHLEAFPFEMTDIFYTTNRWSNRYSLQSLSTRHPIHMASFESYPIACYKEDGTLE